MITQDHIQRFRALVEKRFGLRFDDSSAEPATQALHHGLSRTRSARPEDYLERISRPGADAEELRAIAAELSVGESFFFRYPDQFKALGHTVLPEMMRESPRRRLHMLSAGCASGEEAYSLAIRTRECIADLAAWDIRIVGVDISLPLLRRAAAGVYAEWSLRAVPPDQRGRWFQQRGQEFVLDRTVREMVSFEERNLLEEDPAFWRPGAFDVIFFRNVSIYFAPETTRQVIGRMTQSLAPGGFLFLGPSETLRGISQGFHLRHTDGAFYYQRLEEDGSGVAKSSAHRRLPGPDPVPAAVAELQAGDSWVEAICRASARIASLAEKRPSRPTPAAGGEAVPAVAEPVPASWDLNPALDLLRQERFTDALAALGALPPQSAESTDVLLLRAVLLVNSGRAGEAEQVCRAVLARDELEAGAHFVAALCREHAGDRGGAVEHDQTAVYLDPTFAMPRLHLGLMARKSGDPAAARRELREALTLLEREEGARILMFGGGFSREALVRLCRAELRACGGAV
ncbi:MAG: hypothetical protein AMXMBFR13_34320 [Phycisphaerae bacterium]